MDKYRNSSVSLSPSTNRLLLQQGPKLLMNSASVGTATKFEFIPARNSSNNISGPFQFGMGIAPILNSVKTFFSNLIKPSVEVDHVDTNSTYNTMEKRKCKSAPNIYMDIMSDRKSGDDFDKSSVVDLTNLKMLAKLSSSTKSFSDYNNTKKPQHVTSKMDLNYNLREPIPKLAKESETKVPAESSSQPSALVPLSQANCFKMPHVPTKPWIQCRNRKRTKTRKSVKSEKNKKESKRHELAYNIHEDIATENETMSSDEWDDLDESLVIIAATETTQNEPQTNNATPAVTFSKDDFPAMPDCKVLTCRLNSIEKPTLELPIPSSGGSSFNGKKQRRISDCDSEDSFIVFEKDENDKAEDDTDEDVDDEEDDDDDDSDSDQMDAFDFDPADEVILERVVAEVIPEPVAEAILEPVAEAIPEPVAEDIPELVAEDIPEPVAEVMRQRVIPEIDSSDEDDDDERVTLVCFNPIPVVHRMRTWAFAYEKARKGEWEQCARDRYRFRDRIRRLEPTLAPILNYNHRKKIYFDRYIREAINDPCNSVIQK